MDNSIRLKDGFARGVRGHRLLTAAAPPVYLQASVTIVARFMHYKFPQAEALQKQREAGKHGVNGGRGNKKTPAENPPQGFGESVAHEPKREPWNGTPRVRFVSSYKVSRQILRMRSI
jgi:hypothetical protein